MNWGAAFWVPKRSVARQVGCGVLGTHQSLPGEDRRNRELCKEFLLVAVAWEDEDGGMEQEHVKELGKVLPRGYCSSLNLCAPQGDAPVSSSLCLEGNFFCRIALKAFQNFSVCGENIYEHTWFHFLLPCSLETSCWLPRRTGENKWLCLKCHFRICCIFCLVICGIWSKSALSSIFRSVIGNILILSLNSHFSITEAAKFGGWDNLLGSLFAQRSAHEGPFFMPESSHCCYKPNKWSA